MHRRALLGLAATALLLPLLPLSGCSYLHDGPSKVPMPAPNLTGTGVPHEAQLGGREFALANFRGGLLVVDAQGGYEFGNDKGHITLLSGSLSPYKMDIQGKQGPNAGRTILAAYALENESLTVCYQLARDGERPGALVSPEGTTILLIRYKRMVPARG